MPRTSKVRGTFTVTAKTTSSSPQKNFPSQADKNKLLMGQSYQSYLYRPKLLDTILTEVFDVPVYLFFVQADYAMITIRLF